MESWKRSMVSTKVYQRKIPNLVLKIAEFVETMHQAEIMSSVFIAESPVISKKHSSIASLTDHADGLRACHEFLPTNICSTDRSLPFAGTFVLKEPIHCCVLNVVTCHLPWAYSLFRLIFCKVLFAFKGQMWKIRIFPWNVSYCILYCGNAMSPAVLLELFASRVYFIAHIILILVQFFFPRRHRFTFLCRPSHVSSIDLIKLKFFEFSE